MKRIMDHNALTPITLSLRRTLVQLVILLSRANAERLINFEPHNEMEIHRGRNFSLRLGVQAFLNHKDKGTKMHKEIKVQECDATMFNNEFQLVTKEISA